jgi:hypothetical protein
MSIKTYVAYRIHSVVADPAAGNHDLPEQAEGEEGFPANAEAL